MLIVHNIMIIKLVCNGCTMNKCSLLGARVLVQNTRKFVVNNQHFFYCETAHTWYNFASDIMCLYCLFVCLSVGFSVFLFFFQIITFETFDIETSFILITSRSYLSIIVIGRTSRSYVGKC